MGGILEYGRVTDKKKKKTRLKGLLPCTRRDIRLIKCPVEAPLKPLNLFITIPSTPQVLLLTLKEDYLGKLKSWTFLNAL